MRASRASEEWPCHHQEVTGPDQQRLEFNGASGHCRDRFAGVERYSKPLRRLSCMCVDHFRILQLRLECHAGFHAGGGLVERLVDLMDAQLLGDHLGKLHAARREFFQLVAGRDEAETGQVRQSRAPFVAPMPAADSLGSLCFAEMRSGLSDIVFSPFMGIVDVYCRVAGGAGFVEG